MEEIPGLRFHDIKPLPEFTPAGYFGTALLLLLGLLACLLAFRAWRRRQTTRAIERERPDAAALMALQKLEADCFRASDVRHLGETLSSIVRKFLEAAIGFPALEQTRVEVGRSLSSIFAKHFPLLPPALKDSAVQRAADILYVAEELAFRHDSEYGGETVQAKVMEKCRETRKLVEEISSWIRKEKERTADVAATDEPPFPLLRTGGA